MPSIFRPKSRRKYYVALRDPATGRRVVVPGYTDRAATIALAARIERDAARAAEGITPRVVRPVPLDDYAAELAATGMSATWVATVKHRLARLVAGVGPRGVTDARQVAAWIAGRTPVGKTRNQYRSVAMRYAARCGVAMSFPRFPQTDATRRRRALTPDEVSRLLAAAPQDRRVVYLVAVATGLRKGELRRLQWRDVRDDRVALRESATKSRRDDVIPLRADVAAILAARRRGADATARVFASIPRQATWQRDLIAAGIAYRDAADRVADFHALRYTFATLLAVADVPLRVAQQLMRHSTPALTHRVYLDARQLDTASAVDRLPLPAIRVALTPALTRRENVLSRSGGTGRRARLRGQEIKKPPRKIRRRRGGKRATR